MGADQDVRKTAGGQFTANCAAGESAMSGNIDARVCLHLSRKLSWAQHLRQACNVLPVESSTRDSINWASEGDIAVQKMARERLSLRSVGEMIFGFLRLPEAVW